MSAFQKAQAHLKELDKALWLLPNSFALKVARGNMLRHIQELRESRPRMVSAYGPNLTQATARQLIALHKAGVRP